MGDEAGGANEYGEHDQPSREELSSANDVLLTLVKAAKGVRLYLPNNPVLIGFIDDLNSRMARHIARFGELRLDVEPFVVRYRGAVVYENPDPKDSLAFRLHADGIRVLLFDRGIEPRELKVFLGVIAFEQPSHQDDDIVTQLWERDLPHISYVLEEDLVEMSQQEEDAECPSPQGAITRFLAAHADLPRVPPRVIPTHLLMLTREDAAWLRKARQSEVYRNPVDDVFSILFAILTGVKEPDLFRDFLAIAVDLVGNRFRVGELDHALRLVRFLDQLRYGEAVAADRRHLVTAAIDGLLDERTVQVLQETVDAGDTLSYDDLREFLLICGLPSLAGICELLGRVEKRKARKVIVEVLVELGRDKPEVFAPFLADPRWYLVRNVVLVLSLLDSPEALKLIVKQIAHKEPRIRKEVLGFLERSSDPKAKPYILKYLRDESSALRVRALQMLARARLPFALRPILALATADDFRTRDFDEKKAVYEAIGELGSERELPMFRAMLLKKGWFRKAAAKESVTLAVAGLMRMRTPAARELLEQARRYRNPELQEMVNQAISSIASGREPMPRGV